MDGIRQVEINFAYEKPITRKRHRAIQEGVREDLMERVRDMGFEPSLGHVTYLPERPLQGRPHVMVGGVVWEADA